MWGRTALAVAASPTSGVANDQARAEIVKLLVDKGADTAGESVWPLPLPPHREVLLASGALAPGGALPRDTAVWLAT